jgi:hypothetical protein
LDLKVFLGLLLVLETLDTNPLSNLPLDLDVFLVEDLTILLVKPSLADLLIFEISTGLLLSLLCLFFKAFFCLIASYSAFCLSAFSSLVIFSKAT